MFKINKFIVKPLSSKKENFYLLLSSIILILFAAVLLKMRYRPSYAQEIKQNEISAFSDLSPIEASIYSDIKNSVVDISILNDMNSDFPDISLLEEEEIPPYYRDEVWEQKGALEWNILQHDNQIIYIGLSQSSDIGSFILEIDKNNVEKNDVFYMKEKINKEDILKNFERYENSFKKIIPYTGENERKKFKGE